MMDSAHADTDTQNHVWPRDPSTPAFARTKVVVNIVVPMLGGVTITGADRIPTEGPVILAPNHRAVLDPPYLTTLTKRQQFYMSKEELFKSGLFGTYIRAMGAFPVKRGEPDRAALKQAIAHLKRGRIVTIFPEGTRSVDGSLGTAEKGFALIARQTGAPIVPVAIQCTERIMPKGSKFPHRHRVYIDVGMPISAQEILARTAAPTAHALESIGAAVMANIAELLAQNPRC